MSDATGFVHLDSKALDTVLEKKDRLLNAYNEINTRYDTIVQNLLNNWKGTGANAFEEDAHAVKMNIGSIQEILQTMCDVLQDCRDLYQLYDTAIGEFNADPIMKMNE